MFWIKGLDGDDYLICDSLSMAITEMYMHPILMYVLDLGFVIEWFGVKQQ